MADAAPYQSLYRRYRPQQFAEVLGQDHVVLALKNAVRDQKVSHAYLFSGPRGTGKTSVARIVAKALNCENPTDGEPDNTCDACVRIQAGTSLDVHELDAASNNGVDAMRDLVSRTALGTPGRWKVYIVDEVHMLSVAASNALLKTLEEPPAHVVFVLATTDPQKVLPTIRSRTQHFEFRLLSPDTLSQLVRQTIKAADLHVPTEALDMVVRRGKGSARDTLSVLDQVAAAGIVDNECEVLDEVMEALIERDTGRALVAIAEAMSQGRDPNRVAVDLLEYLRNGFLAMMAKQLVSLADDQAARVEDQANRLGAPALVRAMEAVGTAMQEMRDSPEPRVALEVAIVRLTKPEMNVDAAALLERIERLERGGVVASAGAPAPRPQQAPQQAPKQQAQAPQSAPPQQAAPQQQQTQPQRVVPPPYDRNTVAPPPARPSLGGVRRPPPPGAVTNGRTPAQPTADETPAETTGSQVRPLPNLSELEQTWQTVLTERLPQRAKARYKIGHFVAVNGATATFSLPNVVHRDRCEEARNEVEIVLRGYYGQRLSLELIVESTPAPAASQDAPPPPDDEEHFDLTDTEALEPVKQMTPEERLKAVFPGAEEVQ